MTIDLDEVRGEIVDVFFNNEKNITLVIAGQKFSQFKPAGFVIPKGLQKDAIVSFKYKENGQYLNIVGKIIVHEENTVSTSGIVEKPIPTLATSKLYSGNGSSFNPVLSARQTAIDKALKWAELKTPNCTMEEVLIVAERFEAWINRDAKQ